MTQVADQDSESSNTPGMRSQPSPAGLDSGARLRRIAAATCISIALTAALTAVVFLTGTVIGLWAFDHLSEPELQTGGELSGEGAGLWMLFMFAVCALVVAPILYVVSVLVSTAKLFPRGQRTLPRLVAIAVAPMLWVGVGVLVR